MKSCFHWGLASFLSLAAIAFPASAQSNAQYNGVAGAVFTATNDANLNEIVMYQRSGNGQLHYAGKFATGGRGEGGTNDPLQSQFSLITTADHSYLLAVNAGSSSISVFRITPDALLLVSVTPSGGGNPVSLTIHDDLVYVLNYGGSYHTAGFRLQPWGGLTPIAKSKLPLSGGDPGACTLAFSPDGSKLVVSERITNKVDVFTVNNDGSLSNPVYNPSAGTGTFSLQFTPYGTLLVTETHGGPPNAGTTSSYRINDDNTTTVISANADARGISTCWIVNDGKYAWVSDSNTGNIGLYEIGGDGSLIPQDSVTNKDAAPASTIPLDLSLAGDNKLLYVFYSNTGKIVGYKVGDGGKLTAISSVYPGAPHSGGQGLVAF